MSYSSPPPTSAFTNITVPTRIENEVYNDGLPVNDDGQGKYTVKERENGKNPCKQLLQFIRSNLIFRI